MLAALSVSKCDKIARVQLRSCMDDSLLETHPGMSMLSHGHVILDTVVQF